MTTPTETRVPQRPDLFQRFGVWWKALWWARGIVGALALIGVLDSTMGELTPRLLRFTHALAVKWNEALRALIDLLNLSLPFDIHLSENETNAAAVLLVIMIPSAIGMIVKYGPAYFDKTTSLRDIRRATAAMNVIHLAYCISALVAFAATENDLARNLSDIPAMRFWEQLFWLYYVSLLIAAFQLLWSGAETYIRALIIALTFVATLEVLYFVPLIGSWIDGLIYWLEAI